MCSPSLATHYSATENCALYPFLWIYSFELPLYQKCLSVFFLVSHYRDQRTGLLDLRLEKMVRIQRTTVASFMVSTVFMTSAMGQVSSDERSTSASSLRASAITSASSTPSIGSSSDNSGLIGSLWAGGESLLSSIYPTSPYGNIATLTWPSSVLLGSSTVSVPHSTTPSTTSIPSITSATSSPSTISSVNAPLVSISSHAAEPTQSASDPSQAVASKSNDHNKILGIVLGVVFGVLVLAVVICVFLFCQRRRRRGRILRPYESPAGESEIQSWRQPSSNTFASQIPDNYETGLARPPRSIFLPANPYQHANNPYQHVPNPYQNDQAIRSLEGAAPYESAASEDNPFYTPEERQSLHSSGSVFNEHARVPHDFANPDRPPTPFASALFGVPARKPVPQQQNPHRSLESAIHYPSTSEASDFNFGFAHSKADDFGDTSGLGHHSASGEGWDQQAIHPAYRT